MFKQSNLLIFCTILTFTPSAIAQEPDYLTFMDEFDREGTVCGGDEEEAAACEEGKEIGSYALPGAFDLAPCILVCGSDEAAERAKAPFQQACYAGCLAKYPDNAGKYRTCKKNCLGAVLKIHNAYCLICHFKYPDYVPPTESGLIKWLLEKLAENNRDPEPPADVPTAAPTAAETPRETPSPAPSSEPTKDDSPSPDPVPSPEPSSSPEPELSSTPDPSLSSTPESSPTETPWETYSPWGYCDYGCSYFWPYPEPSASPAYDNYTS